MSNKPGTKQGVLITCHQCWCHMWHYAIPAAVYTLYCKRCESETLWWNVKGLSRLKQAFKVVEHKPKRTPLPGLAPRAHPADR